MGRNIEIKAEARNFSRQQLLAEAAASCEGKFTQRDTFFAVERGRLKVRAFADGTGELIYYHREDASGPRPSDYTINKTTSADSLRNILAEILPVVGEVIKQRALFLAEQTRIHFDRVQGLGEFIELEVVLRDGQKACEGEAIAIEWMERLEITQADLLSDAYIDMLSATGSADGHCSG
ncbi:MAG: class IV adenylate cyclase [Planctomycetota bacterium]|nr:class IV adenylate cyclase [Planctomycetota bacterium]